MSKCVRSRWMCVCPSFLWNHRSSRFTCPPRTIPSIYLSIYLSFFRSLPSAFHLSHEAHNRVASLAMAWGNGTISQSAQLHMEIGGCPLSVSFNPNAECTALACLTVCDHRACVPHTVDRSVLYQGVTRFVPWPCPPPS